MLFDAAANEWYGAAGLSLLAGVGAAVLGVLPIGPGQALAGSSVDAVVVVLAYVLQLRAEVQYDRAETMRRQSVFTEALHWPVSRVQLDEWERKVGKKVRDRAAHTPRDPSYYTTEVKEAGAERLAEMAAESAFYTRHLYGNLQTVLWRALAMSVAAVVVSMAVVIISGVHGERERVVAQVLFAVIPILVSINVLGWALRLGHLVPGIRDVEDGLERLEESGTIELGRVMRLVAEYNCLVVEGIPMPSRLWTWWRPDIDTQWRRRQRKLAQDGRS